MTDFDALLRGGEPTLLEIATLEENQHAVRALAASARRSIDIVSRELDPRLYDDADFVEAVRSFIIGSRQARLRMLVRNVEPIVKTRHRLLGLAHRLTSYCEVRQIGPDHADYNSALIVVDATSALEHPLSDRYEGTLGANHRGSTGAHARLFEEMWAVSQADANLRRLSI